MKKKRIDRKKIIRGIKLILDGVGEDIKREGLTHTPERIADFYEEVLSGMSEDPEVELRKYTTKNKDEMIILKDISFFSLCEHHLLPFFGRVHIAYIPQNNKMVGFSNMIRMVEIFSKRLQVQERLTSQIADSIRDALNAKGVLIVVEAEHLCLTMRGIKKPGSKIVTSAIRGMMRKDATRAEALALLERA
ncbi:MAG: GTP cyclohydrolase I FolE [candidate division Zixibacteria bacterium]|nr:GTP cyclohydrolase I FolE [candidate division Zixibacteria bacterium]MDD5427101.1 GTP cyclohydrolase I FolE [candidate division Zixibacteria bacterium]